MDVAALIAGLPHLPGVYRMLDKDANVLYVGKARDLKKRVSSYFQKSPLSPRIRLMLAQVADIQTTVTRSEAEALLLENNLIKGLRPRYNILFRDDKSYPFVVLTGHRFPRLAFHRGAQSKGSRYFGPFANAIAVRDSIALLQKIFRLRTCADTVFANRSRPCLLYQIKRCSGPCVGAIDEHGYAEDVRRAGAFLQGHGQEVLADLQHKMAEAAARQAYEEAAVYRDQLQALRTVQQRQFVESARERDVDVIAVVSERGLVCVNLTMIRGGRHLGDRTFFPQNAEERTPGEVLEAFLGQHYEEGGVPPVLILGGVDDPAAAAESFHGTLDKPVQIVTRPVGERRVWLEMAEKNARLAIDQRLLRQGSQSARLAALAETLDLPDGPLRIECFDISHTGGEATVAACVVFDQAAMQKGEYRRYNITGITPGDDYSAMREALTRRYRRVASGEAKVPGLILIDGGKGQVGVAQEVLAELGLADVPIVGVAKGPERKAGLEALVFPDERAPLHLPATHPALHLIQEIRDEAHRFAIAGHRARRGKRRTRSVLDEVDGIGPKRRQTLLARFGGLKGVLDASVDELAQVEGISRALAERIYDQIH